MPAETTPGQINRFEPSDWLWVFAYPAYQVIGTIRHEASHALAVVWEGGRVVKFVFWPTFEIGQFTWGYVRWVGQVNWMVSAAPYLADLLTFGAFFLVCVRLRTKRHWLWVNLCVIGLVSPLVNSAYRYGSSFFRDGDLTGVFKVVPPVFVHAYFVLTIALYVGALVWLQVRVSKPR